METTVIGSYPKHNYLEIPNWFKKEYRNKVTIETNNFIKIKIFNEI